MFDIRSSERYDFSEQKVEYSFGCFSSDEIFEADLVNVSQSGICMLCRSRLAVGQEITLRNFMDFSSRTAVVMWVESYEEAGAFDRSDRLLFRVGLQFLE